MKLSVIIVNYNVKHFLEQCLYSVRRAAEKVQSAEVIVVDNASSDGSVGYIRNRFPDIRLIASNENLGFARANNLAMRESKGEYVLLLNPDTIVAENTFLHFVDFMDKHPDAGACGAYMLHTDGTFALESRRGLPTPFVAFCKMSGLTSLFPKSKIFGRYYMRYLNETKVNPIEIVSGAFMFMRREALDKVGLLDEDFFMYGEDIDLSYAITRAGYKNYYFPCTMVHYKGESTSYDAAYRRNFYGAMQLFYEKYYGKGLLNGLLKVITRVLAKIGSRKKESVVHMSKEVVTLSTQTMSYAEIIAYIEQNQGEKLVKIEHPTLQITV